MFNHFQVVSFDAKGTVETGVVFDSRSAGRGRDRRYSVRTISGKTYTVPERLLQPAKTELNLDQCRKLYNDGQGIKAEKSERRDERKDAAADRLRRSGYLDGRKVGDQVKVFSCGFWSETYITRIDAEAGKITVVNPKALAKIGLADLGMNYFHNCKEVITVWANRIKDI